MKTTILSKTKFTLLIILFAIIVLSGCSTSGQADKTSSNIENVPKNVTSQIEGNENLLYSDDFKSIKKFIEAHVLTFQENNDKYKVKQADYNDKSTEGGTIEGYYSSDTLKYIKTNIYGEMGRVSYDIYYIDESCKYFVKTSVQYDNPIGYDGGSNVIEEIKEEYLIINDSIHEYTSDMKMLSDTDEAEYTALINDFERVLKVTPSQPKGRVGKVDPDKAGKVEPNDDAKSIEDLKKEGLKVFEDQSFSIDSDSFGKVTLITGGSEDDNGSFGLRLYLADEEGRLIYEFPEFYGNQWPMLFEVSAVSFEDVNNDGLEDVIVIAYYMTGVGEHGAEEFPIAGVYFQNGKEFNNRPELDHKINNANANSSIKDVIDFLKEVDAGTSVSIQSNTIVPVAFNGLLAGSFCKGKWLDIEKTIPEIDDNIQYSVFSNFEHIGNGKGSLPYIDEYGYDYVSVKREGEDRDDITVALEIGRTGDVLSIRPKTHKKEYYYDIVKGFLQQKFEEEYPECILQGISADLDNDGSEEHVISVSNYNLSDNAALRGWYKENSNFSYLLLAGEAEGEYKVSIITEALRLEADEDSANYGRIDEGEMMIFRSEYHVLGLIDINGDMQLELICSEDVHEGASYYVYEYNNGRYAQVLSCGKGS